MYVKTGGCPIKYVMIIVLLRRIILILFRPENNDNYSNRDVVITGPFIYITIIDV